MKRRPPKSTLVPYTTLVRSRHTRRAHRALQGAHGGLQVPAQRRDRRRAAEDRHRQDPPPRAARRRLTDRPWARPRSEEHTSELQSRQYLVCRLLLENNNNKL